MAAFTLGCVVLAHRNPGQLARLLARLDHPGVRRYLHLDRRVDRAPFDRALAAAGSGDGVAWLPRRATRWGGIEVVDASLDGLRAALDDGCDTVVLLSGQDQPLWPVGDVVAFYREAAATSFLESFPLPDARWRLGGRFRTEFWTFTVRGRRETHVPKGVEVPMSRRGRTLNALLGLRVRGRRRRFPQGFVAHGGSQWWNLSRAAGLRVLEALERRPDYRAFHEHTLLPDEMFFQTLLLGSDAGEGLDIVNDSLRHMAWEPRTSHPRILTADDLPAMAASGKPFARKFDVDVDAAVVDALPLDPVPPPVDPRGSVSR